MKKILLAILCLLPFMSFMTQAQEQSTLTCGGVVVEQFVGDNLSHEYTIAVDSGTRLIIHADPLPLSAEMTLTVEIQNANGGLIAENPFAPEDSPATIETDTILSTGDYSVIVSGDSTGLYQLFVSCVDDNGDVVTGNNLVESLSCGEQIDNKMARENELHRYYLLLEEGTEMDIFLEALFGEFAEMTFEMGLYSPTNQELNRITEDFRDIESQILAQTITDGGVYRLYVQGFDSSDEDYRISVDCSLPDGGIAISGGDNRRVLTPTILDADFEAVADANDASTSDTDTETPPLDENTILDSVMFSDLIEGIPNTAQLNAENTVVGYLFDGEAGEQITLNFVRLRGDTNINLSMLAPQSIPFGITLKLVDEFSASLTLPDSDEYGLVFELFGSDEVVFTIEVVRGE